jgi:hypothetical protein
MARKAQGCPGLALWRRLLLRGNPTALAIYEEERSSFAHVPGSLFEPTKEALWVKAAQSINRALGMNGAPASTLSVPHTPNPIH